MRDDGLESVLCGVTLHDALGAVTYANGHALAILGLSWDQLNGRTPLTAPGQLTRGDGSTLPGEEHPVMEALYGGTGRRGMIVGMHTPQDGYRRLQMDAVPAKGPAGAVECVVCSFLPLPDPYHGGVKGDDATARAHVMSEELLSLRHEQVLLAEAMGGSLVLESTGPQGTSFRLPLPG
ncbi:MAG TPA: hypothetical protein VIJ28_23540 [Chloroflexota bacterium]|jgi:hypothetical protein